MEKERNFVAPLPSFQDYRMSLVLHSSLSAYAKESTTYGLIYIYIYESPEHRTSGS